LTPRGAVFGSFNNNLKENRYLTLVTKEEENFPKRPYLYAGKISKKVCLYHFRKAGGTSLRRYVNELAKSKGAESQVVEGYSIDFGNYFHNSHEELHITSLRDPINRIKSSYLFEGRWPQTEKIRLTKDAKPFCDWVNDIKNREKTNFLWQCVTNYYIKSLIGFPKLGGDGIGRTELERAKHILECFDIVLIMEWMNLPKTVDYLKRILDFDMHVPYIRYPTAKNPEEDLEKIFDGQTLEMLQVENSLDMELYRYGCDITKARLQSRSYGNKGDRG
jgi:hypothetical protein